MIRTVNNKTIVVEKTDDMRDPAGVLLGVPPWQVVVKKDGNGKPFVENYPIFVSKTNVTIGNEINICAASYHPVGIDIEYPGRDNIDWKKLAARFCGEDIKTKRQFYMRFSSAEATVKLKGGSIIEYLKKLPDDVYYETNYDPVVVSVIAMQK
ncbi:MAG: hypothetical protein LBN25_00240 [Christensenellaceae bacterium]|jgi:phosphopantetheinyl transferase|nr:hypothetical protein [Christensenellaceae bacterium]